MPIALLLIGALLIIVAFNNTMGQLATELEADIPGFFVWAIAIAAILGLGYVPGLKTPSRWLLALVVLVIIAVNYKAILSGFTTFASTGAAATNAGATAADPASQFAATGTDPTAGQVAGTSGAVTSGSSSASAIDPLTGLPSAVTGAAVNAASGAYGAVNSAQSAAINYLNPSSYLGVVSGFGGGGFGLGGLSGSLF